jgi:hypothetical protein
MARDRTGRDGSRRSQMSGPGPTIQRVGPGHVPARAGPDDLGRVRPGGTGGSSCWVTFGTAQTMRRRRDFWRDERRRGRPAFILFYARLKAAGEFLRWRRARLAWLVLLAHAPSKPSLLGSLLGPVLVAASARQACLARAARIRRCCRYPSGRQPHSPTCL